MTTKKNQKLNCCEKCQSYWTCETKWYRGEHNKENVCCPQCGYHATCWDSIPAKVKN